MLHPQAQATHSGPSAGRAAHQAVRAAVGGVQAHGPDAAPQPVLLQVVLGGGGRGRGGVDESVAVLHLLLHRADPVDQPVPIGQGAEAGGSGYVVAVGAVGGTSDPVAANVAIAVAVANEAAVDRDDGRLGGQRAGAALHGQRDDALLLLLLAEASAVRAAVRAGVVAAEPKLLVAVVVRVERRGRHIHARGQDEAVRGGGHLRGGLLRQAHESAVVGPAPLHPLVADGRRFGAVSVSAPSRLGTIARPWQLVRKVRRCTLPKS